MRRTLGVAVVATVLTLVAAGTSASADPGDTLLGGCAFNTTENAILTAGQNVGVLFDVSVSREASGLPSTAQVTCWIEVNGVEAPHTRLTESGTGVQVGQRLISFASNDGDVVDQCTQVTFDDGSTWTAPDGSVGTDCVSATST